jgi:hypothetical protein
MLLVSKYLPSVFEQYFSSSLLINFYFHHLKSSWPLALKHKAIQPFHYFLNLCIYFYTILFCDICSCFWLNKTSVIDSSLLTKWQSCFSLYYLFKAVYSGPCHYHLVKVIVFDTLYCFSTMALSLVTGLSIGFRSVNDKSNSIIRSFLDKISRYSFNASIRLSFN